MGEESFALCPLSFDHNGREFEWTCALDIDGKEFSHQRCEKHCFSLGCIRIWEKDGKVRVSTGEGHLKQKFWEQPWSDQKYGKEPREQ